MSHLVRHLFRAVFLAISLVIATAPILQSAPGLAELRLPPNPSAEQVEQYLRDIQAAVMAPEKPASKSGAPTSKLLVTEPVLDPATVELLQAAFAAIPGAHVGALLKACEQYETEVDKSMGAPPSMNRLRENNPFDSDSEKAEARRRLRRTRTTFSLTAIATLIDRADFGDASRDALFGRLLDFPELVTVVDRPAWDSRADAFITLDLVRKIDAEGRWGRALGHWVLYLNRLETGSAREGLNHLLTKSHPRVMKYAYEVVKMQPPVRVDLDAAVRKAWSHVRHNRAAAELYAEIATRHGVPDALVVLVDIYRANPLHPYDITPDKSFEPEFLRYLEGTFPNAKSAADFVLRNKRKLRFDSATGKFRVP